MPVSAAEFERGLDLVRAGAAGAREGVFGPGSMTWRVDREAAVFLGAGRALLLQLAHPWVAAAVADQSRVFADPVGRFHRTFGVTFTMVFGSLDQALLVARKLYQRHEAVTGVLPQSAGPFAAGSSYQANEVAALRWVHATLVETALLAHELVLPPLSDGERERYWSEARLYAALFGIPPDSLPSDWASFVAYVDAMAASDVLTVSPAARDISRQIFSGKVTGVRPPLWYRALTAQLLPGRLREAFELPLGEAEQAIADRAVGWMRRLYPSLPRRLRTVGPCQEAEERLKGRDQPSLATRGLNRLWIGRPSMGNPVR
ncbi:oxygenase MpaB family protein [Bradyrhizobium sp. Tv2a-2]|uniref:oxygenase MpaB family protein n=1 Tax=Bradyrhizobium sp. Tv2a-2 TaxID=113395 RepID=UPI00041DD116|nr:oxygenase MpaB family protein [Bradyrhizobium sp. Tv2a-2]